MCADASEVTAPRQCRVRDLSALVGLLAVIEAELMAGEISHHLSDRIRHRLQSVMLLEPGGTERDLRQAIHDLNHRLRYALGEYEEPLSPLAVPE